LPSAKRIALPTAFPIPEELGKLVQRDTALLKELGWNKFVQQRRPRSDLADLTHVNHPAKRLLCHYKHRGAPVKFTTKPWSKRKIKQAQARGPHKSCFEYIDFLQEEFIDMIKKEQWVILPASAVLELPNVRISLPGCVPQRNRRPRWIYNYSWSDVNAETLDLAAKDSMQFGHALDRILREILLSDPALGPIYLMKIDISDGFYRIAINIDDIPKLGVVFPTLPGEEPLIAFPLVLPMGWKNSPPVFTTATETVADLANKRLKSGYPAQPHHLYDLAETIPSPSPPHTPVANLFSGLGYTSKKTPLQTTSKNTPLQTALTAPICRDPCLPTSNKDLAYIDMFVDDFMAFIKGP